MKADLKHEDEFKLEEYEGFYEHHYFQPVKKEDANIEDLVAPPIAAFLEWIRYLENIFYQAVGVPRVIANSDNYTQSLCITGNNETILDEDGMHCVLNMNGLIGLIEGNDES